MAGLIPCFGQDNDAASRFHFLAVTSMDCTVSP
jgi:hypothetical protein